MIRAKYKSIRTEMLVVYGLGFIIVIFLMITLSELFSVTERKINEEKIAKLETKNIANKIENRIERLLWISEKLAMNFADDITENQAKQILSDFTDDSEIKFTVLAKEKNKLPIEDAILQNDTTRVSSHLFVTQYKTRNVRHTALIPATINDFTNGNLYRKAENKNASFVYVPSKRKDFIDAHLWIVCPIFNEEFNGVVALNIDAKSLFSPVMESDLQNWQCFITDKEKNILSASSAIGNNKKTIYNVLSDSLFVLNEEESYYVASNETGVAIVSTFIEGGKYYFVSREIFTFLFLIETGKIIAFFIVLFLTFLGLSFYTRSITSPFIRLRDCAIAIRNGRLNIEDFQSGEDELSEISKALKDIEKFFKEIISVMRTMQKGDFKNLIDDNNGENIMAITLNELNKELLKKQKESELRDIQAERNTWIGDGLNKFSDLLRQNTGGFKEMGDKIVTSMVKYLKANQSGLFLIEDNEQDDEIYLSLISSYAYDRKKYTKKRIQKGDGLLGTCILEKKIIKLNNLPDDYMDIESGLGKANPGNLIIVPLLFEDNILGAIEVASFKEFSEEETVFMQKVSEVIASSISIIKINQRTNKLLLQSQKQADELVEKERIMRENVLKLQIAQHESKKNETQTNSLLNAIKSIMMVVEYDMEGNIIDINDKILELFGKEREEMIGRNHKDLTLMSRNIKHFTDFWHDLRMGRSRKKTGHIMAREGHEVWFTENFIPIIDERGKTFKVLNIVFDNTEKRKLEMQLQELEEAAKKNSLQ